MLVKILSKIGKNINTLPLKIINYFNNLSLYLHNSLSLFGFFIFIIIAFQLVSGTLLSFSLITEPMLIPIVRDEEDIENLYIDDFFWIHERGVDLFFLFLTFHFLRKLYLKSYYNEQETGWKTGAFSFLVGHGVIFFGLVLCCTHLSEITLTIAANIFNTFFFFKGKMYWWLFTDMLLNTDTIIRMAYIHYCLAFFLLYLGILHGIDMHYDWKAEMAFISLDLELNWWHEGLLNELYKSFTFLIGIWIISILWYFEPEALSYEIFMWGDVGIVNDVRFYGVAPHWYFRPYMAWLIVCPYHRMGIAGLLLYFFIIYFQPNINNNVSVSNDYNVFYIQLYFYFFMSYLYTSSFLPYGRFYNQIGGNIGMLLAYLFVFTYLSSKYTRNFKCLYNLKLLIIYWGRSKHW